MIARRAGLRAATIPANRPLKAFNVKT